MNPGALDTLHRSPPPSADDLHWQAVQNRDAAQDGQFYYAVRTTGIYCRPSCPSRRPRRENVQYFATPAAAQAAGFRTCLRCRPGEVSAVQQAVVQAQALLDTVLDTGEPSPTLSDLGQAVNLSPAHLQRVFKAALGVSPKQYALGRRSERLKAELRRGASVTTALYGAGHASSRTLYDPATDQLGMPPRAYQRGGAGQRIYYVISESVLGPMLVAATERGLCAVRFGDADVLLAELKAEYAQAELLHGGSADGGSADGGELMPYLAALHAELEGRGAVASSLPSDVSGSDFQRRVWAALRSIPLGQTRSYAQVAEMIGEPRAVRAVARACASNPVALVVPCHRIVRQSGELSGYRWGVERKRALLEGERRLALVGGEA